jgi:hypothetical protein
MSVNGSSGRHVAVVGGGIFGAVTAVELSARGHRVTLFERRDDLLQEASWANHRRVHHGYHYPRSPETALSSLRSLRSFKTRYGGSIINGYDHYVGIARSGSRTTAAAYAEFCSSVGLKLSEVTPEFIREGSLEVCFSVPEASIDIAGLRRELWRRMTALGVHVRLNSLAEADDLGTFDHIVVATYERLNLLAGLEVGRMLKFEVVEKVIVSLPRRYANTSVVVLDGSFPSLDPFPDWDRTWILGHVEAGRHSSNVGLRPAVPARLRPHVNSGLVLTPLSRHRQIMAAAGEFLLGVSDSTYRGSLFTVRTVLPGVERTDERPTLVEPVSDQVISILGGKLISSVEAANEVAALLEL